MKAIVFLTICTLSISNNKIIAQSYSQDKLMTIIYLISDSIDHNEPNHQYYNIRGWSYYCLDIYDLALNDYNSAIEIERKNSELFFRRGEVKYALKLYEECIDDYTMAIKLNNKNSSYYISRGLTFEILEQYEYAMSDYNNALKIDPNNELALCNVAILLGDRFSEYQNSILYWDQLLKMNEKASYYNDRGRQKRKIGLLKEALIDFNRAIKLDSTDYIYYLNKAYVFGLMGKYKEALIFFNTSLKLEDANPIIYKYRGEIHLINNEEELACKDFKKAVSLGMIDVEISKCK